MWSDSGHQREFRLRRSVRTKACQVVIVGTTARCNAGALSGPQVDMQKACAGFDAQVLLPVADLVFEYPAWQLGEAMLRITQHRVRRRI